MKIIIDSRFEGVMVIVVGKSSSSFWGISYPSVTCTLLMEYKGNEGGSSQCKRSGESQLEGLELEEH